MIFDTSEFGIAENYFIIIPIKFWNFQPCESPVAVVIKDDKLVSRLPDPSNITTTATPAGTSASRPGNDGDIERVGVTSAVAVDDGRGEGGVTSLERVALGDSLARPGDGRVGLVGSVDAPDQRREVRVAGSGRGRVVVSLALDHCLRASQFD